MAPNRLDAISQGLKNSRFPGPNPLPLAHVMDAARIKSITLNFLAKQLCFSYSNAWSSPNSVNVYLWRDIYIWRRGGFLVPPPYWCNRKGGRKGAWIVLWMQKAGLLSILQDNTSPSWAGGLQKGLNLHPSLPPPPLPLPLPSLRQRLTGKVFFCGVHLKRTERDRVRVACR